MIFWSVSACAVVCSAGWNLRVFLGDVWPASMAPCWLGHALDKFGIERFYTYDNPYNDAFVKALPPEFRSRHEIIPIHSLAEVQDGLVVVPGTSSKAFNMESEKYAIRNGDFNQDPLLTRLIETKEIERYAVASFKTFGTSRMWVHESGVTSYRDLILKEISDHDRWRGRAWILDAGKLQAERHP